MGYGYEDADVKVYACVCVEKNRKYAPSKLDLGRLVHAFGSYAWNEGVLEVGCIGARVKA